MAEQTSDEIRRLDRKIEVLIFRGAYGSIPKAVEDTLGRAPDCRLVCALEPSANSAGIHLHWKTRVLVAHPHAALTVMREPDGSVPSTVCDYVDALKAQYPGAPIDVHIHWEVRGKLQQFKASRLLNAAKNAIKNRVASCEVRLVAQS